VSIASQDAQNCNKSTHAANHTDMRQCKIIFSASQSIDSLEEQRLSNLVYYNPHEHLCK